MCVCVVSVIVKRPVLPPCVVDGRSRNLHYYYYYGTQDFQIPKNLHTKLYLSTVRGVNESIERRIIHGTDKHRQTVIINTRVVSRVKGHIFHLLIIKERLTAGSMEIAS